MLIASFFGMYELEKKEQESIEATKKLIAQKKKNQSYLHRPI